MKPIQVVLGVGGFILLVLAGMAITNPSLEDYQDFATLRLALYLKENACKQLPRDLGEFVLQHCQTVSKTLIDIGRPQLKQFIGDKTVRHDFLLFSIYETTIALDASMPIYEFETIGMMQYFYIYSIEERF
jgi:hypothetical protein